MAVSVKAKRNKDNVFKSSLRRKGWQVLGGILLLVGILLLINLPRQSPIVRPNSTPIIVHDGLIIQGSGAELYIFRNFILHQIINPTPTQQAIAQRVSDSFLGQYICAEPVTPYGQPVSEQSTQSDHQFCPLSQPVTTPLASFSALGWWLVVLAGLVAGVWWVSQAFPHRQTVDPSRQQPLLQQMTLYATQIEQLLQANPNHHQQELLSQINQWRQMIEELVGRLADLQQHALVYHDLANIPETIVELERQLALETNSVLRMQLRYVINQRKSQLEALEHWQNTMRQAEIQVELTVALLGTIYSQLLTQQSTSHVTDYQRLTHQAGEEVARLQDYLEALQEVKRPAYEFA